MSAQSTVPGAGQPRAVPRCVVPAPPALTLPRCPRLCPPGGLLPSAVGTPGSRAVFAPAYWIRAGSALQARAAWCPWPGYLWAWVGGPPGPRAPHAPVLPVFPPLLVCSELLQTSSCVTSVTWFPFSRPLSLACVWLWLWLRLWHPPHTHHSSPLSTFYFCLFFQSRTRRGFACGCPGLARPPPGCEAGPPPGSPWLDGSVVPLAGAWDPEPGEGAAQWRIGATRVEAAEAPVWP